MINKYLVLSIQYFALIISVSQLFFFFFGGGGGHISHFSFTSQNTNLSKSYLKNCEILHVVNKILFENQPEAVVITCIKIYILIHNA